jgi:hypothetical protein
MPLPRATPTRRCWCASATRAVDDFYNSIFRTLLTHMMENPHNITPATHLLFRRQEPGGASVTTPQMSQKWSISPPQATHRRASARGDATGVGGHWADE